MMCINIIVLLSVLNTLVNYLSHNFCLLGEIACKGTYAACSLSRVFVEQFGQAILQYTESL
jgi:hypothetical protein